MEAPLGRGTPGQYAQTWHFAEGTNRKVETAGDNFTFSFSAWRGEGEGGLTRLQVEVVGQAQHQHVWP